MTFQTGIYVVLLFATNPVFFLKGQLRAVKLLPVNLFQPYALGFYIEVH